MVASIHDNTLLQAFLKSGPHCVQLVRRLEFDYFGWFKEENKKNADLELAAEYTGLRSIELTFHSEVLTYWALFGDYDDGLTAMPLEAESLFERFRLKRLLDCAMLKSITIGHAGRRKDAAYETGENLGELLVTKFADTKRQKVMVQQCR